MIVKYNDISFEEYFIKEKHYFSILVNKNNKFLIHNNKFNINNINKLFPT